MPLATLRAIEKHEKPSIYVVGPQFAISDDVLKRLRRYGTVRRIAGPNPTDNAVAGRRRSPIRRPAGAGESPTSATAS